MSEPYARVPDVNQQVESDITPGYKGSDCRRAHEHGTRAAGAVYGLFAGAGGAYAEKKMLRTRQLPREYRGCSGIRIFCAFGPVPARHQAKDGEGPGKCAARMAR